MKRRRRKPRPVMPDPRLPLRIFVGALPGLIWLLVLAVAAWYYRPLDPAERLARIEARVAEMEIENGR